MQEPLGGGALIYQQIAQTIEDDILRGVYQEEEQVPSTNELSRAYRINPATAGKGLNLLVAEGILYKRRGLGMFVAPGAAERVRLRIFLPRRAYHSVCWHRKRARSPLRRSRRRLCF